MIWFKSKYIKKLKQDIVDAKGKINELEKNVYTYQWTEDSRYLNGGYQKRVSFHTRLDEQQEEISKLKAIVRELTDDYYAE